MISKTIKTQIEEALSKLGLGNERQASGKSGSLPFVVELTKDMAHGDYTTNVALQIAGRTGGKSLEIAKQIVKEIGSDADGCIDTSKTSVAGAGFINFWLSDKFYADTLKDALEENPTSHLAVLELRGARFGWNNELRGKKVMVEYAQPNPFKQFHIGHLMGTIMGECYARLHEAMGASVLRANYQGDIGLHVAYAIYGMREMRETLPEETDSLSEKAEFLGKAYAFGATQYKNNPELKIEIDELNKKLYQKNDSELNELYDTGRRWSLEYFDLMYKRLGTRFDHSFFESEMAPIGMEVVAAHREVFKDSDGAVIFPGEEHNLHARVFINSQGLPTYETKELGLNKHKFDLVPLDLSIVETANEINDYFRVLLKVMELIMPEVAKRTKHVSHGMLRLPTGKMSSRTGDVITAEALLNEAKDKVKGIDEVAVGALKYSILKQAPGRDIIFDMEKSLSLEGDSGPYIQYAYTRAKNVLAKANFQFSLSNFQSNLNFQDPNETKLLRMIGRFPEIVSEAQRNLAPQLVCTYLIELAGEFHHFYATNRIADAENSEGKERRLALTTALAQTIQNGLWLLGISTVEKM